MNKYAPHVYVIPEDDRNRQIAVGFVNHPEVDDRRIQVMPSAGGWSHVRDAFRDEYIPMLNNYPQAHVLMLIDFDGAVHDRRGLFEQAIPMSLKPRVFVVGSEKEPEMLKRSLNVSFENIGKSLADDCETNSLEHWNHDQLRHNDAERQRLIQTVKPFLFR